MKFLLSEFKIGVPVQVTAEYDPQELDMEFIDLKYMKKISMTGVVEKGEDTLHFHGHLSSRVEHLCGRCLVQVQDDVAYPFDFFYEIRGQSEIDALPDLREIFLLDHPINFVCRDDCRGLCPNCGINLNEATCQCHVTPKANAFRELKKLKMKVKERKTEGA